MFHSICLLSGTGSHDAKGGRWRVLWLNRGRGSEPTGPPKRHPPTSSDVLQKGQRWAEKCVVCHDECTGRCEEETTAGTKNVPDERNCGGQVAIVAQFLTAVACCCCRSTSSTSRAFW